MCVMEDVVWSFEQAPHEPTDETGINLRAYLADQLVHSFQI
jgi:hypothetical protein